MQNTFASTDKLIQNSGVPNNLLLSPVIHHTFWIRVYAWDQSINADIRKGNNLVGHNVGTRLSPFVDFALHLKTQTISYNKIYRTITKYAKLQFIICVYWEICLSMSTWICVFDFERKNSKRRQEKEKSKKDKGKK